MKIELIRIPIKDSDKKKTVGWNLIAETIEEKLILGSVRNAHFWGDEENEIKYNGYLPDPNDNKYVGVIKYATDVYMKDQRNEFIDNLLKESDKSE